MRSRSATMTSRAAIVLRASIAQRSGPIPAGSPAVTAMVGASRVPPEKRVLSVAPPERNAPARSTVVESHLDVRAIPQLAHPFLVRLVGLARSQRLAGGHPAPFFRYVLCAAFEHLYEMQPEWASDRLADLARLQLVHCAFELGNGVAGKDPAEVPAARCACIFGMDPGEL